MSPSAGLNVSPGEARADVAVEHAHVRSLVCELVREATQTASEVSQRAIRERLAALRAAVEHVVDTDERELVPLLREADAWGPARVERIREKYARMLAAVADFEHDLAAERHASCDLVARTEELVRALSSDLEEERSALAASQQAEDSGTVVDQEDA